MIDDLALLQDYLTTRSQPAFAELARRYTDLVYSSAKRQLGGDEHLAQDLTQAVFAVLAQKAHTIPHDRPLSAWLLKVTAYCAANARRQRTRRESHERRASDMASAHAVNKQESSPWDELAPLLDQGLNTLPRTDRDALLLRFFEHKSLRQVGEAMGTSEEAAQKRVARAVDKLRDYFHRHGITTASASAVSALLISQAVQAAPAGLAASAAAAGGGAAMTAGASGAIAKGALIVMAAQKVKVVAAVVLLVAIGVGGTAMVLKAFASPRARTIVVDDPAAGAIDPRSAPSPWPVKFSDGTVVEVLAVNDSREPNQWWSPDGTPVSQPAFRADGSITMSYPFARRLDLILRVRGAGLNNKTVTVRADPRFRTATLLSGTANERLIKVIMAVPLDARTTDLRIGLSSEPWRDDVAWDPAAPQQQEAPETQVRFGGVSEEKGQAVVQLFRPAVRPHDRDERIVVFAGGKELKPIASHSKIIGEELHRFRCAANEVTKVALQSRPYEWMEMKSVSVAAGERTQAVQVSPAPAEGGQRAIVRETIP